ncbi:MAG: hypothetical protein RMI93_07900 [Caldimicrobium sp.]|nr:hypothetical protein [Caldimicrobium sp.]MDW8183508.1 hypothetical protein [Caldimicrobium sp.]
MRDFKVEKRRFNSEKDLRLFVKKLFKDSIRGMPEEAKPEISVLSISPPRIRLFLPFVSEGNFIRNNEVDFFLAELYNWGIEGEVLYTDDLGEREHL